MGVDVDTARFSGQNMIIRPNGILGRKKPLVASERLDVDSSNRCLLVRLDERRDLRADYFAPTTAGENAIVAALGGGEMLFLGFWYRGA